MCGRYSITATKKEIEQRFGAEFVAEWHPNYNAAPSQLLPIILNEQPEKIVAARWGLIPSWAKDEKYKMINARAETVCEKQSYRKVIQSQRCLVLADGFYEWKKNGQKVPYRIIRKDKQLFAFAGIWEMRDDAISFTIITLPANPFMQKIHERMPLILSPDQEKTWLTMPFDNISPLLVSTPTVILTSYEVSTKVGSPANNSPALLAPVKKILDDSL